MHCEVCEAEEAAFTIIPVAEGMPQSLGPACFARAGLEIAKAVLPAEEIAATLGPMFVTPARQEALAKDSKRRGRKAPAEAADQEPETGPAAGPAEAPPAAENG